ncbi:Gfo/Idh/MocA family protein [Saccharothrix lopnurensis]|uniref:Gfo/Idh/MocA family protein n=1 Tax=Saccharothrix lopnurensis TaxID=1670621 RepID=A0ABW1PG62_9PSEU
MRSNSGGRSRRRYAVVGAGHRAALYVEALAGEYADVGAVVAWCDPSPTRMSYYDAVLGHAPARYAPERFADLLREQRPDAVIVTSPDATHHHYAVAALRAGCDVVVEKPLTTTAEGARAISDAVRESGGELVVTFNYRYSPRNEEVRRLIAAGAVGEVTSVHFEWVLDTVHGADYFRRWHRDKAHSGGLLVHKASHHFDLVNWWLHDVPSTVFALGGLRFYGAGNAARRGLGARPERSTGAPGADRDPFALDLAADDVLRRLYLEAEADDGYLRDRDVFSGGITTEDNLSVVVGYGSGASLSYSLNAHSPWEGYRVAVNGTEGRVELDVVERGHVLPAGAAGVVGRPAVDPSATPDRRTPGVSAAGSVSPALSELAGSGSTGSAANPRPAGERLLLQRHWSVAEEVPVPQGDGPHGGGDAHLLDDVFRPGTAPDPLGRRAGVVDGLRSAGVGIAANLSLRTGQVVRISDLELSPDG